MGVQSRHVRGRERSYHQQSIQQPLSFETRGSDLTQELARRVMDRRATCQWRVLVLVVALGSLPHGNAQETRGSCRDGEDNDHNGCTVRSHLLWALASV
eukprot:SAG11_NODE_3409_length_2464_cov_8.859619_2_plen_99_part_00